MAPIRMKRRTLFRRILDSLISFCSPYERTDEEKPDPIYILTSDNQIVETEVSDCLISRALKEQLELAGEDKHAVVFAVDGVRSDILRLVLKFGKYHKGDKFRKARALERAFIRGDQEPGPSNFRHKFKPEVGHWDTKFMESVKQDRMMSLWNAGIILVVPKLLDLMIFYTANWLKGKTHLEIREAFAIESDYTPEEELTISEQAKFSAESSRH